MYGARCQKDMDSRSLSIDERLPGAVNIGCPQYVTVDELVETVAEVAGKEIHIKHIEGPVGVRGRNSDNLLVREKLGWGGRLQFPADK